MNEEAEHTYQQMELDTWNRVRFNFSANHRSEIRSARPLNEGLMDSQNGTSGLYHFQSSFILLERSIHLSSNLYSSLFFIYIFYEDNARNFFFDVFFTLASLKRQMMVGRNDLTWHVLLFQFQWFHVRISAWFCYIVYQTFQDNFTCV